MLQLLYMHVHTCILLLVYACLINHLSGLQGLAAFQFSLDKRGYNLIYLFLFHTGVAHLHWMYPILVIAGHKDTYKIAGRTLLPSLSYYNRLRSLISSGYAGYVLVIQFFPFDVLFL
ncbi:hypothetical protein ACFX15_020658 [Malus domestica]